MMQNNGIKQGTIRRLFSYITRKYKIKFLLVCVSILLSSVASVVSSLFLQILIDDYITPLIGVENPIFNALISVIGIMAVIYIVGIIAGYLYSRIMALVAQGVLRDIRNEMFEKMQKLPINYFDTHTHGEIMSYYTNDTDTLRQMLSQGIPQLLSSVISIIAVFCSMIYLNKWLTLCVVIFSFVIVFITRLFSSRSAKYYATQQESLGKMNGYIEEMLSGEKVIKVFNHEDVSKKDFSVLNCDLNSNMYQANKFSNVMMPIANNLGNLQYVLIAVIASYLSLSGIVSLTIGTVVSFLQLTKNFMQPINQVMNMMNQIILSLAGASRIFTLMDELPECDDGFVTLVNIKEKNGKFAWRYVDSNDEVKYVELKGDIVFDNVNFGYYNDKQVLYNINLHVESGQKVAFVGATGAGKTTITNLLNRFYDIEDGKILFDGIDINCIKKADLRKSLGMVLQDTCLFTGTIGENIKYGKLDATDEEMVIAAKLANAHNFIERLLDGYDTMITGNGQELSQGQRQLIAIARCAIGKPSVMILDEATSSVDTRTEKIIQDGLDKVMESKTVFVIAHRLSTVRNSEVIIVMGHGNVIESGQHDDLIKNHGEYYQLYTGALELE